MSRAKRTSLNVVFDLAGKWWWWFGRWRLECRVQTWTSKAPSKIARSAQGPSIIHLCLAERKPMTPLPAPPLLKLRRLIWADGGTSIDPEDYEVIDARGERVGRIKRTIAVGGQQVWNWTVYGIAVTNHPPAGQAPTRDAAQAAFKAAWATCQPRERGA
jgi:hypothetical protein